LFATGVGDGVVAGAAAYAVAGKARGIGHRGASAWDASAVKRDMSAVAGSGDSMMGAVGEVGRVPAVAVAASCGHSAADSTCQAVQRSHSCPFCMQTTSYDVMTESLSSTFAAFVCVSSMASCNRN
jgi:hypothetical protein